ncbi:hypothetical protein [Parasutterella sp.]|uniref:hypothetical protein n=1 Tax=Parasutterella sp. TaxID=2049037 RepID=UPI00352149AE
MKKLLTLAGLIVACSLPFAAQSLECSVKPKVTSIEAPQSYMFVGNSYTYYSSGLSGAVNGLAKAAGIKVKRNRMVTIGAADLGWFNVWELVRPSGMASTYVDHSDAVILQDNSTGPIHPQRKEIFEKYAKQHAYDLQCFSIQPLIMMTWARKNKPEMTQQLADATTKVGNEADAMVIPVGLAFAEAIKQDPKLELYRADKTHPSPEGTYLEACVVFASMYHRSPVGLKYYGIEKVEEKTAHFLQEVAWNTVCEYFGWKK